LVYGAGIQANQYDRIGLPEGERLLRAVGIEQLCLHCLAVGVYGALEPNGERADREPQERVRECDLLKAKLFLFDGSSECVNLATQRFGAGAFQFQDQSRIVRRLNDLFPIPFNDGI
jgi:hypothetical protein